MSETLWTYLAIAACIFDIGTSINWAILILKLKSPKKWTLNKIVATIISILAILFSATLEFCSPKSTLHENIISLITVLLVICIMVIIFLYYNGKN